uniref:Putative secreted protein n=1 Tax=Xenopsylla cheopis TaxID=163159 RepID=A0A6M2E0Y0_XENCH
MYVCMYVCVYVCMYVCVYGLVNVCMYVDVEWLCPCAFFVNDFSQTAAPVSMLKTVFDSYLRSVKLLSFW